MNPRRDHLLGFPPVLLIIDEPGLGEMKCKNAGRTPQREKLSKVEKLCRYQTDCNITRSLDTPKLSLDAAMDEFFDRQWAVMPPVTVSVEPAVISARDFFGSDLASYAINKPVFERIESTKHLFQSHQK